jgi:hypothetical protein
MECLWRLFGHWQPHGNRHQQNPPVFYLYFPAYVGFTDYHLPGAGFLEKYEEIYLGSEEKPLVLSLGGKLKVASGNTNAANPPAIYLDSYFTLISPYIEVDFPLINDCSKMQFIKISY